MDIDPLDIVRKVWRHNGVTGNVWLPTIRNIGKPNERFSEGKPHPYPGIKLASPSPDVDSYWTPAVSHGTDRRAKGAAGTYPAQRVAWVDCDESYDRKLLEALRPSYMWETSPGHTQAIWLLKEPLALSEYHRDGFMGMLAHALGGDKSGVDVGQLLRIPGSFHHKRQTFQGKVLRAAGTVYTRGALLSRVAKCLGFSAALASEIGAEDPYGDRSKLLWKFERNAAELGLDQKLTFKLIKACAWNKWKEDPDRLKEDIANAYEQQPAPKKEEASQVADNQQDEEDEDILEPWSMATVGDFGPVIRTPVRWVLPGIIPEAGCGLIVAAPKVGKTRVAIEIALGLASASKPLGIHVQRRTPVGFFSIEDGEHLFATRLDEGMRSARARFHWDGHVKKVGKKLVWYPPEPMNLFTNFARINLGTAEDRQRFHMTITELGLKLVIIDTLSVSIGNANVSDQKEMNQILPDLRDIARDTNCAILFIHHTRKRIFEKGETIQESILGSTALHAWAEFVLNLVPPQEDMDLLRLGVQTKRGGNVHYLDSKLKIIKKPVADTDAPVQ